MRKSICLFGFCFKNSVTRFRVVLSALVGLMLAGNATATITPRYYVQDSLLMMIDGEYNSTNSVGEWVHDATTKKWIDLSGNGYDFAITDAGTWNSDNFYFNGYSAMCDKELPYYRTQEIVCTHSSGRWVFCGRMIRHNVSSLNVLQGFVSVGSSKTYFQTAFCTASKTLWMNTTGADTPATAVNIYSPYYSLGSTSAYSNGSPISYMNKNDWGGFSQRALIGDRRTDDPKYKGVGNIYIIRLYSRELTNEEIEHNNLVDSIRFRGGTPPEAIEPAVAGMQLTGGPAGSALIGCTASALGWLANEITTARIEYSSSESFDGAVSLPFAGSFRDNAQILVEGLEGGATYHARIVATNNLGAGATSDAFAFTAVESSSASDVVEVRKIVPGDYYVDITGRLKSSSAAEVTVFVALEDSPALEAGSVTVNASPGSDFTARVYGLSSDSDYVVVPKIGDAALSGAINFSTKPSSDYVRRGRSVNLAYNPADKTRVTLDFEAPGKAMGVYVLADTVDRGIGEWAYKMKVADITADQTSAVVALPEGWGERYFALRYYIGEENSPLLAASQRYSAEEGVNLINHWDAIDNAGVDKFDSLASRWIGLCGAESLMDASSYGVDDKGVCSALTPSGSYISGAAPSARNNVELGSFTMEMFVRPLEHVDRGGYLTMSATSSRGLVLDMGTEEGQIRLHYRDGKVENSAAIAAGTPVTIGEYQHIAVVCSNHVAYLYINGDLVHQRDEGATLNTSSTGHDIMIGRFSASCDLRLGALRFWDKPLTPEAIAANSKYDRFRFLGEGDLPASVFAMSEVAYHYISSTAPSLVSVEASGLESGDMVTLSGSYAGNVDDIAVEWWLEGASVTNSIAGTLETASWTALLSPCKGGKETFYRVTASGGGLEDVYEGSFTSYGQVDVNVTGPVMDSATVSFNVNVTSQGAGDTWVWVKRGSGPDSLEENIGEPVRIESGDMNMITVSGLSYTFDEQHYFGLAVSNSCTDVQNGVWEAYYNVSEKTVVDESIYRLEDSGSWTDPSIWSMEGGLGKGYPNGNAQFYITKNDCILKIEGQYSCSKCGFNAKSVTFEGIGENARLETNLSGTGNGYRNSHITFKNFAFIESDGVSMYGNNSGNNSLTLVDGATYSSGGRLSMQSTSEETNPVTINISDTSLMQLVSLVCFGAGVHNINLAGAAPRIRTGMIGESVDEDRIHTGTINLRYTIPAELSAAGYAETPILLSSDSVFAAFSANENEEPVKVIIDPGSTVLKSHCPKTEFKLIESFGGIDTNRIALAQNIGHVELEWEYGYGWSEETGSSLGLSVPESTEDGGEEALPTLLKVRFYRHGLIFKVR